MEFAKEILASNWPEWQIVDRIGKGSYGEVFKIVRRDSVGIVQHEALKIIKISSKDDETDMTFGIDDKSFVDEIVSEIKLMSELKGKTNIVSYEDHKVIKDDNGMGWTILIRMELLTPLKEYLKNKEPSVDEVKKIGVDICKALEECQKRNIVHRDIKPDNIFVSKDGDFKLGDFGTARSLKETLSSMSFKGTLLYMAPEVVKREKYGIQADIYSLGIFLYKLLNAGKFPLFSQDSKDMTYKEIEALFIRRINGEKLPAPCNADSKLSSIILKACEHDAKKRFASASDFKKALETPVKQPKEKKQKEPSKETAKAKENKKPKKKKEKKKINIKINSKAILAVVLVFAIVLGVGTSLYSCGAFNKKYLKDYESKLQDILYRSGDFDSALAFDFYGNDTQLVAVTAKLHNEVQPETYVMFSIDEENAQILEFNNASTVDFNYRCYEEILFVKETNYIVHRLIGEEGLISGAVMQTVYELKNGKYEVIDEIDSFNLDNVQYYGTSDTNKIISLLDNSLSEIIEKDVEYVSYNNNKTVLNPTKYLEKNLNINLKSDHILKTYIAYSKEIDRIRTSNEHLEDIINVTFAICNIVGDSVPELIIDKRNTKKGTDELKFYRYDNSEGLVLLGERNKGQINKVYDKLPGDGKLNAVYTESNKISEYQFDISDDTLSVETVFEKRDMTDEDKNKAYHGIIEFAFDCDKLIEERNREKNSTWALTPSVFHCHGGGNWATSISIDNEGNFTGDYQDLNRGEAERIYPEGTTYIAEFEGKFSEPEQVSPHVFKVTLENLTVTTPENDEFIEDGMKYIYSSDMPGLESTGTYYLYFPGAAISMIDEDFSMWARKGFGGLKVLPDGVYGIFNEEENRAFVG